MIVIPQIIYGLGEKEILKYVSLLITPYLEDTEIEPYVIVSKEEINKEYEENIDDYEDINELCKKIYGGYLNENGCVMTTLNKNALWESYEIVKRELKVYDIDDDIVNIDELICDCDYVKNLKGIIASDQFKIDIVLCDGCIIKKSDVFFYDKIHELIDSDDYYLYLDCSI